ncbi:peptidoglycan-binding protein [Sorangium sp. So ce131]|uniref:peptidoglycan-binding protein n=1 Tax=Sorangium sp. So ce131 TaxID=3133282 RepID=UPI003F62ECBC
MDYIIKQGDHLTKIAVRFGFTSYDVIWNHPRNAELKARRRTPNVLMPGDRVFIPDREVKSAKVSSGKRHFFKVKRSRLQLRLAFLDFLHRPIANTEGALDIQSNLRAITDGDGRMELIIAAAAEGGTITLPQGSATIHIGHLDPIDEESGLRARLANLGYLIGVVEDADDTEELRFALQEFQADHGIKITGAFDDATRAKLLDIHGC